LEVERFPSRDDAVALALTMEARGHKQMYWVVEAIICDATRSGVTLYHPGRPPERLTTAERQLVHDLFEQRLAADWPPYIHASVSDSDRPGGGRGGPA
jgi:hypothetical protein